MGSVPATLLRMAAPPLASATASTEHQREAGQREGSVARASRRGRAAAAAAIVVHGERLDATVGSAAIGDDAARAASCARASSGVSGFDSR